MNIQLILWLGSEISYNSGPLITFHSKIIHTTRQFPWVWDMQSRGNLGKTDDSVGTLDTGFKVYRAPEESLRKTEALSKSCLPAVRMQKFKKKQSTIPEPSRSLPVRPLETNQHSSASSCTALVPSHFPVLHPDYLGTLLEFSSKRSQALIGYSQSMKVHYHCRLRRHL